MWRRPKDEEVPEYKKGRKYTQHELSLMADAMLKADSRAEMCRECNERGAETGKVKTLAEGVKDESGQELHLDFPEFSCKNGHIWYQGEGAARGIGGENPILFEEHLQSRRRREIFPANGTPDPSIVVGIYNRSHPQGRKINSEAARRTHGASYYR